MSFFEVYNCRVIKYDLVNAFVYQNLTQMPRLEKVILNFGYPKSKLKNLISGLLALEFLSSKKGKITKSKHLNIFLLYFSVFVEKYHNKTHSNQL